MVSAPPKPGKEKRRLRVPKPAAGTGINYSGIADKYGAPRSTVQAWEAKGEITRMGNDPKTGAALFDELSVWERCRIWSPNRDSSASSRVRTRNLAPPATQQPDELTQARKAYAQAQGYDRWTDVPEDEQMEFNRAQFLARKNGAPSSHAAGAGGSAGAAAGGTARPAAPKPGQGYTPPGTRAKDWAVGVDPQFKPLEILNLYYQRQTNDHGVVNVKTRQKELREDTRGSYDWAFGVRSELQKDGTYTLTPNPNPKTQSFARQFQTLPWDRDVILDGYIYKLKDSRTGRAMSEGSKRLAHRQIASLYNWLRDTYSWITPNLKNHGIPDRRPNAVSMPIHHLRILRTWMEDRTEEDILIILAQTGMRVGELCTIRAEFAHDMGGHGWVEVWGKNTPANPTGWRQVPVPSEAWKRLTRNLSAHRQLTWMDMHGKPFALAGPIEQADPDRKAALTEGQYADIANPVRTYVVNPAPDAPRKVGDMLRNRMKRAGMHEKGKNCHSLRRIYQGEALDNGMDLMALRRIMGHYQKANIDDLYYRKPISELAEIANRCAPRRFLQEQATQGEMALDQKIADMPVED